MVNNIIAYGPDGKVFLTAINFPSSWHDGSMTANILPYIHERIGNYKCVLNKASQEVEMHHLFLLDIGSMRGLQGTFPRFKKTLPGNSFKRSLVIQSIVLIQNFRTEIVGLNLLS
jgi:hypothetical protein